MRIKQKSWLIFIILLIIPSAIAPAWYGTPDGLVLHIACEGNFDDLSGQGKKPKGLNTS